MPIRPVYFSKSGVCRFRLLPEIGICTGHVFFPISRGNPGRVFFEIGKTRAPCKCRFREKHENGYFPVSGSKVAHRGVNNQDTWVNIWHLAWPRSRFFRRRRHVCLRKLLFPFLL